MKTTYEGELQLMNWGESSNSGAWVKFWIPPEGLESFRDLKTKSGKIAGHRMMAVLVEIGDDEQPVQREEVKDEKKIKPRDLCIIACKFCKDINFQHWVHSFQTGACQTEEEARQFILDTCGVLSRKELDNHQTAANRFHALIRQPFLEWKAQP